MRPTILSLIALSTALADVSCVDAYSLPREDHCAQRAGNQWCAEQYPNGSRPFCGRGYCQLGDQQDPAARDGCLAERPADDTCYSPCGDGTTVLEDPSCLAPEGSTGATTTAGTTDEPSSGGDTNVDPIPGCGNGLLEGDEACDDGELNGTLGQCAEDCQGSAIGCGDGEVQDPETCDDGDAIDGNGCNTDCRESGAIVWERETFPGGIGVGIDVAPSGAIYLAAMNTDAQGGAWAARICDEDGSTVWATTLATPPGIGNPNVFFTSLVLEEGVIAFAGRHAEQAHLRLLDAAGGLVEAHSDPGKVDIRNVVPLADGYLANRLGSVIRYGSSLTPQWSNYLGYGLAYRPGDNVALLAVYAGFRRVTLDGVGFEPVAFPLPPGLVADGQAVEWTALGDVVVAGKVAGGGAQDALVIKSSSGGQLRWMYGPEQLSAQNREGKCLAIDSEDAVIVGGLSWVLGEKHPFLMKLSAEGDVLWMRHVEFQAIDSEIWGCTTNAADEIIVIGESNDHIWAAKLTP